MEGGDAAVDSLRRNYRLGKTLGHGSFGKVKIAEHVRTGHKVAIKIINRRRMGGPDMEEKVRREIKICRLFVHPHVIRLYEVIETPADIYVIMEHVLRGELFDYIVERGRLQEDEARHFFQQIIAGVEYCHRNMVVHRDLKPENLLLDSKGNVKIADFGLSNVMRDGHFLRTSCGSPNYAAPEVVSGKLYAGPEVDVWSCGVILYALLCGALPFDDENIPNLFKKIKSGLYTLPSHLSSGARDLIPRMLVVDPMKRITTRDIRQHPWFKAYLPRYLAVTPPNATEHLKRLDEEIIQEVLKLGFDRSQLIDSLQKRLQNEATVAYYLLSDKRSPSATGYLSASFQETTEINQVSIPDLNVQAFPLDGNPSPRIVRKKQWAVGIQSPARPGEIMTQILGALQGLNVRWKKIGHYNMKCLFTRGIQHVDSAATSNCMNDNHYVNGITPVAANGLQLSSAVKFEIQLYKTSEVEYLLDLQRLSGPVFLFLDFCAYFVMRLEFRSSFASEKRAPDFDVSELETLFSATVPKSDAELKSGGRRKSTGSKTEKVHLIDLRRANNTEIMLTKVKMPLPDMMAAALAMDESILDADQVENLIKFCPTKEEMELLKAYTGDKETLGKCELFFMELMKVPRVESKLRVFLFKIQFNSQVSDFKKSLNTVNSACEEVRRSVKLKEIMKKILYLGNTLNQGTARGSAVGFKLDSLLKLADTRASNNKITLMHYLCKVLASKTPALLDFHQDLVSLEFASKIQLKSLAEEMQAIIKGLEKVKQELAASENDGPVSDTFRKTLTEFVGTAESEVAAVTHLYSIAGRNADALALYFGEDPARCPFEQVIATLLNFVRMFRKAHEENCKQAELEKKKKAQMDAETGNNAQGMNLTKKRPLS